MQNNTILAIDPGYDRCGVALITDRTLSQSWCIQTSKQDTHPKRLAHIYESLRSLIEEYHPTHIALETLFFSVNKTSAIKVAEARGIVVTLAGLYEIELVELSPQAVKQSMTGVGNASKEQVQKMTALTLKLDIKGKLDDEIDAIALGIAASETIRVIALANKKSI